MGNYFCLFSIYISKVIAVCFWSTISIRVSIFYNNHDDLQCHCPLKNHELECGAWICMICVILYIYVFLNSFVTRIERELVVYRRRCPHQSEQFVQPPYIDLPCSSCSLACLTLHFYIMSTISSASKCLLPPLEVPPVACCLLIFLSWLRF